MELSRVSIIVPVYKAEKSIRKCIESILKQIYTEIELILIDDGSPDKSGDICDEYQKDPRVKVIHTQNRGVSHARNVGLNYANGDYITFCDSDDFYEIHFIEKMIQSALKYNSDITICGYYLEGKKGFKSSVKSKSRMIKRDEVIEHSSIDNEFGGFCWNKLYRREVIGKDRFPEDMDIMEDTYFLYVVSQRARRMYYLAEPLYYYCTNKNSAVRNISNLFSNNNTVKYIDASEKILADIQMNNMSKNLIRSSMVTSSIRFRCLIKQKKYNNKSLIDNLNKTILSYNQDFYACQKITLYEKLKWTIKYLFPLLHRSEQ
ncbi:MAG: glycosyltransferase [Lactobacillus amylovorus]|jgi:glycosyltransferase involved in cell wall biosynthesis|nr:glycosyltransferase [Lactobacillus amylovorus]